MKKIFTLLFFIGFLSGVIAQTADFTYQSTTGLYCSPSNIKFTVTASGTPTGYVWNFGNNNGSNSENPTTTYTTSGTFTVRLIVIYKKNTVQVSKTITINPGIIAHITADRTNICTPGPIHFTADVNEGISSYVWNFGDNTPAVSSTLPSITHNFTNFETYPISLKAIAPTGCYGESFTTITVEPPSINASVSPLSGCIPATVHFNASVGLPPASVVTRYIWDFGEGGVSFTTTVANTTHTYNSVGYYTPKLHIITNDGCSNDFIFPKLAFGIPPTNHIAYPKKTTICGSESLSCVSKATNANKFFWDFGEGDTTSITDTVIQHKFRTLGTKTITVTPLFNDCPGTAISFTINVIGVIAGYNYANTCSNKKTFTLSDISQGNQSTITWNFGDGSPASHAANLVHSYPDTGSFVTSLTVTDNITGCADTYTKNIYTAFPLLTNPDSSICKNSNTTFSIPHNYNNPAAVYNWNVVGLQSTGSTPFTTNASVLGNFTDNYVIINNGSEYCPDTIKLKNKILVRGPLLDFTAPAEICLAKPFNVSNLSRPFVPTDIINDWHWDYGIPGESDSVFQPQPYYYPYWGLPFKVKLTAIDMNGCMDTLVKSVMVYDIPFLRSIPDVDTLCAGKRDTLIAFHNDPIIWSPSNSLSCTTCDTVIVNPTVSTTYYVKATNRFNCIIIDSIAIYVYPHFTAVPVKAENYICANEAVKIEITPSDKIIRWQPPIGLSDSTIFNPIASPRQSTSYTVTLTDSVGCFSSTANVNVHVKSLPVVNAGADVTYPYNTSYSFAPTYSNNVSQYVWTPAALLSCSTCAIPHCIAIQTQTYTVTVISDSGCVATDKVNIFIECKYANLLLPDAFSPNHDNLNDYFYPITRGIKKITRFSIYNRQGQIVFDRKDFDPNINTLGWDGNLKGLPESTSTYVYNLEAICEAGEKINKKGTVILIR